ncbi:hypothetical protein C1646_761954 [Rhizophagus diaphanus]|nr:hypothetical protein C1646_761954 [Rhizophagus diaphanus] [Rhizophagus sp. MUCL 43196]
MNCKWRKIERLENTSEEEMVELKSEISSLKSQLYQTKKDVQDKEKYISDLEKCLEESEEQNTPERGNSPDLYNLNINLEMATITELANAIDGYVENRTTVRDILIDQIKRAIRQNVRQYNRKANPYWYIATGKICLTIAVLAKCPSPTGQIFALQNNLPHIGMAGYAPKRFSGRADKDIDEFIKDYRFYLMAANITTANADSKQRALELFQSCLTDEVSRWVKEKLIVASNNANINGTMINAPDGTLPLALLARATGATVIPAYNVHADEDWSLAGGCPVDTGTATNASNGAINNNNQIVLPDINISQVIYWFKRNYSTIVQEQQELIFGTLIQGSDSVRNFYRKIDKYASWAQISDREKRIQFMRGLSPENKLEMKRLGLNRPLDDDLIEILEEIETARNNLLLDEDIYNQPAIKTKLKAPFHQNITTEDIDRIVNRKGNVAPGDDYNYDSVDDITDGMTGMTLNKATINAIKSAVKKPDSDSSSEDTPSSDSSDSNSSSDDSFNSDGILDMSRTKLREIPLEDTIHKVLQSELRLIFPPHFFQDFVSKQIVAEKIVSCFSASGQNDILASSKDSDESSLEEESLDDPMEINFIKKKELKTSVATVKCKIKRLKIPAMTLDSEAEPPIITENIVECIGAKIDKSEIHDLEDISTVPVESIRVVCNLPITLAPELTIIEDFIIMRYHKPTLIFSNKLLKKYRCAVNWNTNELKIPLNGKNNIIPVTMHKIKNKLEVNCANITPECDVLPAPDCISQDLDEDDILKKNA